MHNYDVVIRGAAPARIYNLYPRKGCIAVGSDADIVVWDPNKRVTIQDTTMHDRTGFTPFIGSTVQGWPEIVLRRGETIVRDGSLMGKPGSGQLLPRSGGAPARPSGRIAAEIDPQRNFGVSLL